MPVVTISRPAVLKVRVNNGITPRVMVDQVVYQQVIANNVVPHSIKTNTGVSPRVTSTNSAINSLSKLTDVNMTNAEDGSVVVYQASTNNFIVETLSTVIHTTLDGGSF